VWEGILYSPCPFKRTAAGPTGQTAYRGLTMKKGGYKMRTLWGICKLFGIEIRIDSSWIFIFGMINRALTTHYFPSQYPLWPTW